MPCYGPLRAWRSAVRNPNGKRPLVFKKTSKVDDIAIDIPCGQCIGCKLERSRQWAMRCLHEARLSEQKCFLTLTYRDSELPAHGSLELKHLQEFMKRLRHRRPQGLRFFACGEYGENFGRPHFHVLLLNTSFADLKKRSWGLQALKYETYVSAECSQLWTYGDHCIASLTFESCAYVTAYCTKVITGDKAVEHYGLRRPEFCVMSRRPGLGTEWFNRFGDESYRHDNAIVSGREAPLTRFYDNKFEKVDCGRLEDVKFARRMRALERAPDNTSRRRWTKERLKRLTLEHFKKGSL